MKTTILFAVVFLSVFYGFGQHGGNQVYDNNRNRNSYKEEAPRVANTVISGSDGVTYKVSILNNVKADSFVLTLGLNQEATTVKVCNAEINKRIEGFKALLRKLGIKDDDIYIDFISQTKIYDYKSVTKDSQVDLNQVAAGFEMKKNVILKIRNIDLFDKIIDAASEFEIHNIIKVDYFNLNTEQIYNDMLTEANHILEQRKKKYSELTKGDDLKESPKLSINFYAVQPGTQYDDYTAFESSNVTEINNYYNSNKVVLKHEERKSKTFYYNGIKPTGFDKVLNADTPVVGLQYVMEFTESFTKEKSKQEYKLITPNGEVKTIIL
jgi:hypothetical protein